MIISSSAFAGEGYVKEADAANKYVTTEWRLFNKTIDSFFSNQKYLTNENKSNIQASITTYKKEGESIQNDFDLNMRFDLPRTTKKLKIVVEKEQSEIRKALSDENVSRRKQKTLTKSGRTDSPESSYSAGANYLITQTKEFTSLIKIGFRIDLPINPYAKLNLNKEIDTQYLDIGLSQQFLLYRQAGFQEISQIVFDKKLSEVFHVEQLNSLVWTAESDTFILRNNLTFYQTLTKEKGISYAFGATARIHPVFYYESYDASVSYRQQFFSKWLFGTWTVGADFPKERNFDDEKFVQFRLEVFFK